MEYCACPLETISEESKGSKTADEMGRMKEQKKKEGKMIITMVTFQLPGIWDIKQAKNVFEATAPRVRLKRRKYHG